MNTKRVIKELRADGWYEHSQRGSHKHFKHPTKPGKVTVKMGVEHYHPTVRKSMESQAGFKFEGK